MQDIITLVKSLKLLLLLQAMLFVVMDGWIGGWVG